jgi:alpha-D-ribose 1-methylphosphonate 5-triphosphate diphosphatase
MAKPEWPLIGLKSPSKTNGSLPSTKHSQISSPTPNCSELTVTIQLSQAKIVTPTGVVQGSLSFKGTEIADIVEGPSQHGEDCDGDWLIPGIIDIHTDNLERHFFPRANIDWNPVSAAVVHDGLCISVGVTTVFDSLSIGSFGAGSARTPDNLIRLTDALHEAHDKRLLKATHRLHWRCEAPSDVMAEWLPDFADAPLTGLFSLMDHTPGQRQYRNIDKFLDMWRREGLTEAAIEDRLAERRANVARHDAANRRLVVEVAKARGVPIASHDDESVAHIDEAADLGATIAEFPVTMEAAQAAQARGMHIVMGGPNLIRGGSYSGNVPAKDLIAAGLPIGFASDYVPRSLIECAFALAAGPWQWPIERAVDTVTGLPARAVGLNDRGTLEVGKRADVVRVKVVDGHALVRGVWTGGVRVG